MTIILQSFRSVYPKTDLSFRRKEIGAAVLPFRLRRVVGRGVFFYKYFVPTEHLIVLNRDLLCLFIR